MSFESNDPGRDTHGRHSASGGHPDSTEVSVAREAYRDAAVVYFESMYPLADPPRLITDSRAITAKYAQSNLSALISAQQQRGEDEEVARSLHGIILWETPAGMKRYLDVTEASRILSAIRSAGFEVRKRDA